jgi:hypothetical protein
MYRGSRDGGQRIAATAKHPRAAWIAAGSLNYHGQPELPQAAWINTMSEFLTMWLITVLGRIAMLLVFSEDNSEIIGKIIEHRLCTY